MAFQINLPEGVEFVGINLAGDDDFSFVNGEIRKGKRPGAASDIIVKPAEGYAFQPARTFDIREYRFVDGPPGVYTPVRMSNIELRVSAKFVVDNDQDAAMLRELFGKLNALPGYVESTLE